MALLWLPIAAVIFWVVWFGARPGVRPDSQVSAEERLRRRFANGKIDEDEYCKRLAILKERDG